jgi:hypothetical protein
VAAGLVIVLVVVLPTSPPSETPRGYVGQAVLDWRKGRQLIDSRGGIAEPDALEGSRFVR